MPRREVRSAVWVAFTAAALGMTLHFLDNTLRFEAYRLPGWLSPRSVPIAWGILTGMGLGGLLLFSGSSGRRGRGLLYAYCLAGQAGYLHYLYATPGELTLAMNAFIWIESLTALALAVVVRRHPSGKSSASE